MVTVLDLGSRKIDTDFNWLGESGGLQDCEIQNYHRFLRELKKIPETKETQSSVPLQFPSNSQRTAINCVENYLKAANFEQPLLLLICGSAGKLLCIKMFIY